MRPQTAKDLKEIKEKGLSLALSTKGLELVLGTTVTEDSKEVSCVIQDPLFPHLMPV